LTQPYAVFCGVDVGKGGHQAVGLDPAGKRLFDKALPNDESRLRAVFDKLAAHGRLLIVVDQPNTIGPLPVTVARACGHDVAYLPGFELELWCWRTGRDLSATPAGSRQWGEAGAQSGDVRTYRGRQVLR
jgi:hypothetical protein